MRNFAVRERKEIWRKGQEDEGLTQGFGLLSCNPPHPTLAVNLRTGEVGKIYLKNLNCMRDKGHSLCEVCERKRESSWAKGLVFAKKKNSSTLSGESENEFLYLVSESESSLVWDIYVLYIVGNTAIFYE